MGGEEVVGGGACNSGKNILKFRLHCASLFRRQLGASKWTPNFPKGFDCHCQAVFQLGKYGKIAGKTIISIDSSRARKTQENRRQNVELKSDWISKHKTNFFIFWVGLSFP